MIFSKIIEMDIWSNFGCFSKSFSTTGGIQTYLIPPKTSIIGIIGAILGYDFEDFIENENIKKYKIEELYDIKISVQPLFDFKTKRVTFNRVSGNLNDMNIENIRQDVLINPYYKIFISFPNTLNEEEKLFLERISNHQTVYNLYMGKNEFPLSMKLCNTYNYDSISINNDNFEDHFNEENEIKIFGLLDRSIVKDVELTKITDNDVVNDEFLMLFGDDEGEFPSYYEYIIREYPIKRKNFNEFVYCTISFYSTNNFNDCYYSNLILKDDINSDESLELANIGENKWISMI